MTIEFGRLAARTAEPKLNSFHVGWGWASTASPGHGCRRPGAAGRILMFVLVMVAPLLTTGGPASAHTSQGSATPANDGPHWAVRAYGSGGYHGPLND